MTKSAAEKIREAVAKVRPYDRANHAVPLVRLSDALAILGESETDVRQLSDMCDGLTAKNQELACQIFELEKQLAAAQESRLPEPDDELRRWQDAIRDLVIKLSGATDDEIDGAGCDSGDPLDLTLTEIAQGFNHLAESQESRWQPTLDEINLCRQWYNAVEDLHPDYLDADDAILAIKLIELCGLRVSNRTKARSALPAPPEPSEVKLDGAVAERCTLCGRPAYHRDDGHLICSSVEPSKEK